jgi:hypothetical protein
MWRESREEFELNGFIWTGRRYYLGGRDCRVRMFVANVIAEPKLGQASQWPSSNRLQQVLRQSARYVIHTKGDGHSLRSRRVLRCSALRARVAAIWPLLPRFLRGSYFPKTRNLGAPAVSHVKARLSSNVKLP